ANVIHIKRAIAAKCDAIDTDEQSLVLNQQGHLAGARLQREDTAIGRLSDERRAILVERNIIAGAGRWRHLIALLEVARLEIERDEGRDLPFLPHRYRTGPECI